MKYEYCGATPDNLQRIWEKDIAENQGDNRWVAWRDKYINYNHNGMGRTFVVLCNNEPVGQGTLLFSPNCTAISGRTELADNVLVANINALRIQKEYEGKGHISRLVHEMEKYVIKKGYTRLTIGVEARETRNLAIYLHWGYNTFMMSEIEEGELVLYYSKNLKQSIINAQT